MDALYLIQQDDALAVALGAKAREFELQCRARDLSPASARLSVMWGGGKDSTVALLMCMALSELLGCRISATTMVHPGLSPQTIHNLYSLSSRFSVPHDWRAFTTSVSSPHESQDVWKVLYQALAQATDLNPRFMCVGCNLGATVCEFQALKDFKAHFRVTGNPSNELRRFDEWGTLMKSQFSAAVSFPAEIGNPMLDYYRLWWAIYQQLLLELSQLTTNSSEQEPVRPDLSQCLYEFPVESDFVADAAVFSVLGDSDNLYSPVDYLDLLKSAGWSLPKDIQGGTESDCMMPAAIATLDIHQNGMERYLTHLSQAVNELNPLPEMYSRSLHWAQTGQSELEGERLLTMMGVSNRKIPVTGHKFPVAQALVQQLLLVR